jgi:transcriptional antiterminator Rof (Rho-off)
MEAIDTCTAQSGGQRFIRQVNDSVYDVVLKLEVEDGEFWCECSDPTCDETVLLTLREYAALRQREGELLLSRDHARRLSHPT